MKEKSVNRHFRTAACFRARCMVLVFSTLVFLHALISAPLLVQCIGADGRGLIEILGNDPCHACQASITAGIGKNPAAGGFSVSDFGVDPCQDSMLDSPGCNSPQVETTPAAARATDSVGLVPSLYGAGAPSGLAHELRHLPLVPPGLDHRSSLNLRI